MLANFSDEIDCIVCKSFTSQALIPPCKCPSILSKPTRDNRVAVSCSLSLSHTNKIDVSTVLIIAPTQGAKPPSIPIKIESGIKPFTNSF